MGLDIVLQTETGRELGAVADPRNLLIRVLARVLDGSLRLLPYVDAYGDTVFNVLQMEDVIKDFDRLQKLELSAAERELLLEIRRLAERVRDENAHLYLKFVGD